MRAPSGETFPQNDAFFCLGRQTCPSEVVGKGTFCPVHDGTNLCLKGRPHHLEELCWVRLLGKLDGSPTVLLAGFLCTHLNEVACLHFLTDKQW